MQCRKDRLCSAKPNLYASMPASQLQSTRYTGRSQRKLLQATLLTVPLADAGDVNALSIVIVDKTLCKAVRTL